MAAEPNPNRTAARRAAHAERSTLGRHLRRLWYAPWTRMALTAWPAGIEHVSFATFHYWWQAHVLETLIDAEQRAPDPARRRIIDGYPYALGVRNGLRWTNEYYDDIAWFGIALDRRERELGMPDPTFWLGRRRPGALSQIVTALDEAWDTEPLGGGIPWRVGDPFRNVPANGPMAILMARRGHHDRAAQTLDWMNSHMLCPDTGLVLDGMRPGRDGGPPTCDKAYYTYNQGVLLGTEVEVARFRPDPGVGTRVLGLLRAIESHMTHDGVLYGFGDKPELGGDRGLFAGILMRYLALVATDLPDPEQSGADLPGSGTSGAAQPGAGDAGRARDLAADLVCRNAEAVWAGRTTLPGPGHIWFAADWRGGAQVPSRSDAIAAGASAAGVGSATVPERDMSVQVGAWMALEAAHTVERHTVERHPVEQRTG